MQAIAQCESLKDLLTGFKVGRLDLHYRWCCLGCTRPLTLPHSLGRMVLPKRDWGLEEQKGILLLVGSLLSKTKWRPGTKQESYFSWIYQSDESFFHKEGGSEDQLMLGWFREDVSSWKPKDGKEVLSPAGLLIISKWKGLLLWVKVQVVNYKATFDLKKCVEIFMGCV